MWILKIIHVYSSDFSTKHVTFSSNEFLLKKLQTRTPILLIQYPYKFNPEMGRHNLNACT